MTQITGSFVNLIQGSVKQKINPEVGMGVTVLHWTDRSPATIIKVEKNGTLITIQGDNAIRTDNNGMSESQEYDYSPNPTGAISHYRLDKKERWGQIYFNHDTNRWNKSEGRIRIGSREKYHDFSF